jgi:hypothetical protein
MNCSEHTCYTIYILYIYNLRKLHIVKVSSVTINAKVVLNYVTDVKLYNIEQNILSTEYNLAY